MPQPASPAPFRVVLPGAHSSESLFRAACALGKDPVAQPIVIGRREDFVTTAHALGIEMNRVEAVWPVDHPALEEMVQSFLAGPMEGRTGDQARAQVLNNYVLFAAGLIATGHADAVAIPRSATIPAGLLPRSVIPVGGGDAAEQILRSIAVLQQPDGPGNA